MRRNVSAVLITLALALTACGEDDEGGGATGAESSDGGEPITLSVGVDSVYAPMFLAEQEDLWSGYGIEVQLRQFAQGGAGVDAMLAGEIDTAGSADSTFLVRAVRSDIVVLGPYVEDDGNYVKLVVRDEITDPSQIERIGVIPGQISEYGAVKFLESEGIERSAVEFVEIAGPAEFPPLLQQGEIDAFVLNEPWPTRAQELGGKVLMDASAFDLGYTLVIATTPEWVRSHQEEARALMRAMDEATRLTEEQPELAAEATEAAAKVEPELVMRAVEDLQFGVRDFDDTDRQRLRDVAEFLREAGVIEGKAPVEEVFASGQGYVPEGTKQGGG